jgi:hypothetical protein
MTHGNGSTGDVPLDPVTPPVARHFLCDGEAWLAWPSGASAYGTGVHGPAALEAVHFARADGPERPAFEALLPAGRFHGLFEEELVALLRGATRVAEPGERPVKAANRRGAGLL